MEIRYVGKSTSGLARPKSHGTSSTLRDDQGTYKANWINSLIEKGLTYEIVILAECSLAEELDSLEKLWIGLGREALGKRLTNATKGGDGSLGYRHTEVALMKMRVAAKDRKPFKGHQHSQDTKARIAHKLLGRKASEETRIKQSKAIKATRTPEVLEKISNASKNRSPETRAKLAEATRRSWLLGRTHKRMEI